jgi:hypothetical protein
MARSSKIGDKLKVSIRISDKNWQGDFWEKKRIFRHPFFPGIIQRIGKKSLTRRPERLSLIAIIIIDREDAMPEVKYQGEIVQEDCTVYCKTCNKTIELKKGEMIPLCCGKPMELLD